MIIERRPLSENIGEAELHLDRGRERYRILFEGTEATGGTYEAMPRPVPLKHQGELQSISGDLHAIVPALPWNHEPETGNRIALGGVSASHYVEDRVLWISGPTAPALEEDDLIQLSMLFERHARHHFPEATILYRFQDARVVAHVGASRLPRLGQDSCDERVLRRLGYRLLRENRRKPDGRHDPLAGARRTWVK